ncbi:prepilin-type N-terminal cleavage/methylation domain-containing protein [Acholeplasma equirhinis]|uniref:PulJ/GspJ family protein n=1 Tax=Acholeplasma equirhinis TaxID=555393 RepID=UPI00197AF7E5|nr:prepilin-type N-terminal cleavage/methylation domain-containing protein [Acholeplasma equirhinis]MBN3491225.1 prepilin-type N-terminal cleavage/methylation domain-containing protein [Acholeplasma equirhinis]
MKKGFTLVEMIISIAVSAILLLMVTMIAVFSSHMLSQRDEQSYMEEIILLDQYFQQLFDQAQQIEIDAHTLKVDDDFISLTQYSLIKTHTNGHSSGHHRTLSLFNIAYE